MGGLPSDKLKYLSSLAQLSQALGAIALFASLFKIFLNENLDISQKIGQLSLELLGFAIVAYVTQFIGLLFVPPFALIAAVFVAVSLAVAVAYIKALYFTLLHKRQNTAYA